MDFKKLNELLNVDVSTLTTLELINKISEVWNKIGNSSSTG